MLFRVSYNFTKTQARSNFHGHLRYLEIKIIHKEENIFILKKYFSGSIGTADGSLVKLGNTTVICGIKARFNILTTKI